MAYIFQPQLLAKDAVISYLLEQLSSLQYPRMLKGHPVVGLHPLVVVDNVVEVDGQGDSEGTVLANNGHAELDACKSLNIERLCQATNCLRILTFQDSGVTIVNSIL